ncbi:MAG: HlyC/CorC family transporter [Candidatus Eremiobacteraeota bacterium]|nr:HlyC/CorC family transporter [Candidatus Eremiobacteraeota bacterium]
MPASSLWELLALALLVGAAAFFAASEAALISVSRIKVRQLAEHGVRGSAAAAHLLADRSRMLATVLIGNTVVLLAADSLATAILIREGIPHAAIFSTLVMSVLILLFGEIVPKTVAVSNSQRWAVILAPWLERVAWFLTPVERVFVWLTNLLVRPFGVHPYSQGPFVTEEDIRTLVNVGAEQKVLEEEEREMIHSVIEFGDTIVREVMTPRPKMVCMNVENNPRHALDLVISEGYSKLPVFETTIDNIVGVVHDRELLVALANGTLATSSLRALMRPVTIVPENKKVAELLRAMQREKFSLAIVIDEYGGTAGLVTMEDLLEEIVGEIRDEHDIGEEEPIRIVDDDEAVVDAGVNIEDLNAELGTRLPYEEFETIGGYTIGLFGRLPHEGEEIAADDGVRLRVERMRNRRIQTIRVLQNGKARAARGDQALAVDAPRSL